MHMPAKVVLVPIILWMSTVCVGCRETPPTHSATSPAVERLVSTESRAATVPRIDGSLFPGIAVTLDVGVGDPRDRVLDHLNRFFPGVFLAESTDSSWIRQATGDRPALNAPGSAVRAYLTGDSTSFGLVDGAVAFVHIHFLRDTTLEYEVFNVIKRNFPDCKLSELTETPGDQSDGPGILVRCGDVWLVVVKSFNPGSGAGEITLMDARKVSRFRPQLEEHLGWWWRSLCDKIRRAGVDEALVCRP